MVLSQALILKLVLPESEGTMCCCWSWSVLKMRGSGSSLDEDSAPAKRTNAAELLEDDEVKRLLEVSSS